VRKPGDRAVRTLALEYCADGVLRDVKFDQQENGQALDRRYRPQRLDADQEQLHLIRWQLQIRDEMRHLVVGQQPKRPVDLPCRAQAGRRVPL
jgi:hypothetical protein